MAQVDVSHRSRAPSVQARSVVQVHPCGPCAGAAVPKSSPDGFGLLFIWEFGSVSELGGTMD